jgi:hypothetical protein
MKTRTREKPEKGIGTALPGRRSRWILSSLAVLMAPFPSAAVQWGNVSISGFGTLGVSCFTSHDADYTYNLLEKGPGNSSRCDPGLDSNLGAQIDYRFSELFEVTAQATAYRKDKDNYEPELTLGYLRWHATDKLTFRFGRMQNPLFLYSEFRMVHYAQPWVRPPREVYSIAPVFLYDGVESLYRDSVGRWEFEFQGGVGATTVDSGVDNALDVQTAFLNLSVESDAWLFKAGYLAGLISQRSPGIEALFDGLRAADSLVPGAAARADELEMDNKRFEIVSAGARYETPTWLVIGEYGRLWIDAYYRVQEGLYFTVGRRFGPWMPYVTAARRWTHGTGADHTLPRGRSPELDALAAGVDGLFFMTRLDDTSVAVGLSRELTSFATLKLEGSWMHVDGNSHGPLTNHAADYDFSNQGDDVLLSVNLDFAF